LSADGSTADSLGNTGNETVKAILLVVIYTNE
jgi:hypothetical protein